MLADLFFATARQYPARTALVYQDLRWSWAELASRVRRLSRGLEQVGIGSADLVGLWLDNSPAFVVSFFAVLTRGATVVPFNPASRRGDISVDGIDIPTVITSKRLDFACRQALETIDERSDTVYLVCGDPECCDKWNLLGEEEGEVTINAENSPALLLFSSGSTGHPKALYRTHAQCVAEARHFKETCKTCVDDVVFCAIPLFHAHGMGNALWAAAASGASLVLMPNPQPFTLHWERALALLNSERVTIFPGVPLFFDTLAKAPDTVPDTLDNLRLCFSAGSALPLEVYKEFKARFNVSVRSLYGCTEAGSVSINLDTDIDKSASTVGYPMQGVQIEVRNSEGVVASPGESGEVVIRSESTACSYLNAPQLNQRCFHDGWFMTGDTGSKDDEGRLIISGRKALVIDVAGQKVYAPEIEAFLCSHESIEEAAVIGMPDDNGGEKIKVVVVTVDGLSADEILAYCKARLPSYKVPKVLKVASELPKTAMGKIAKSSL